MLPLSAVMERELPAAVLITPPLPAAPMLPVVAVRDTDDPLTVPLPEIELAAVKDACVPPDTLAPRVIPLAELNVIPLTADKLSPEESAILPEVEVKETDPPAVIASLEAILVPVNVSEPTLVPLVPVVMVPPLVIVTFSALPNVLS